MKKVIFSAAALMLASAFSFAGTPETKTNTKPEVKTEASTVYHFVSKSGNQITFAQGEPLPSNPCSSGSTPCRWESNTPLTSPMSQDDIEDQATVTNTRP